MIPTISMFYSTKTITYGNEDNWDAHTRRAHSTTGTGPAPGRGERRAPATSPRRNQAPAAASAAAAFLQQEAQQSPYFRSAALLPALLPVPSLLPPSAHYQVNATETSLPQHPRFLSTCQVSSQPCVNVSALGVSLHRQDGSGRGSGPRTPPSPPLPGPLRGGETAPARTPAPRRAAKQPETTA